MEGEFHPPVGKALDLRGHVTDDTASICCHVKSKEMCSTQSVLAPASEAPGTATLSLHISEIMMLVALGGPVI